MRIISFHVLHDANVSITENGIPLAVLELERVFDTRYYCSPPKRELFETQWRKAIHLITNFTGIDEFDLGITSWVMPSQKELLTTLVKATNWISVDHHVAHASLGFFNSPFNHALILSYDGGGNDGTFNIYYGNRSEKKIQHLEWLGLNLGTPYRQLALCMPEVTREKKDLLDMTTYMRFAPLALSGKVMGYSALGKIRKEWIPHVREYYEKFVTPLTTVFTLGEKLNLILEPNSLSDNDARDLAATSQFVFSQLLKEVTDRTLEKYNLEFDGIVLTGGCALNVNANQDIFDMFGYSVYVPPAPNDCGISLGACWFLEPPPSICITEYLGLPAFDSNNLTKLVQDFNGRKVSVEEIADLLLKGSIIGVIRGRQEFGPRALGNRSILCYPDKADYKEKLNKMKSREWFRPLCPSIMFESIDKMFDSTNNTNGYLKNYERISKGSFKMNDGTYIPLSKYMSFAPKLKKEMQERFPSITHFDGTARVQIVEKSTNEWYHALLNEISKMNGGYGIVLNTSFNVKGKPILNNYSVALDVLCSTVEMDYVILEDYLIDRVSALTPLKKQR